MNYEFPTINNISDVLPAIQGRDETDDRKIVDCVRNTIRNNLSKTVKYEAIRAAWFAGVKYNV